MNLELYIELLEKEVSELRKKQELHELQERAKELSREHEQQKSNIPMPKRAGGIAGILGVTKEEFNEAHELCEATFNPPKNLISEDSIGYDANGSPTP